MRHRSIGERVVKFHGAIRESYSALCRISIALYHREEDLLHTFASSTSGEEPFVHYQVCLSDVPSLLQIMRAREPRVVDDLSAFSDSPSLHTQRLLDIGVRSSYTAPMFAGDEFIGFVFFDADVPGYFTAPVLHYVSLYGQLVSALVANDLNSIRTLKGAVLTAREFSRFRDEETADHLSRMSHYCREIALRMAADRELDDEYIEFLFQFSPLHDIGKVAVPDRILAHPDALHGEDLEIMRGHVTAGVRIVDTMIREFGFSGLDNVRILRNLVATHHEQFDGGGYPQGLAGESIPLEGRIVAIADVFDALTSNRPYKQAWTFERALEYLEEESGRRFDPGCVDAVQRSQAEFRHIHARYQEAGY